jgi:hypothetical protein
MNLKWNFAQVPTVAVPSILRNNNDVDWAMDDEKDGAKSSADESNAGKFRDYAAECRRLAQRASEKDRKVLMDIAQAWDVCAEEAEKKQNRKGHDRSSAG